MAKSRTAPRSAPNRPRKWGGRGDRGAGGLCVGVWGVGGQKRQGKGNPQHPPPAMFTDVNTPRPPCLQM